MNDPTSEKAISDLVLLSHYRTAETLGLNLSPSEVMTLAALAAERDRLAARLEKAESDCAMFADANARQAMCISFTASNLGPEYSATIEGLPKAARHVSAERDRLETAHRQMQQTLDRLSEENARLREALIWCSGSADFNEGGIAADGWQKLCAPLLKGDSHE